MSPRAGAVFITGTDTGCGKTMVARGLLQALQHHGIHAAGMKPVASGCCWTAGRWVNDDARQLQAAAAVAADYDWVNPWALQQPLAPHLAAAREGREITLAPVIEAYDRLAAMADYVVVEGVGGWRVPLSEGLDLADMVRALALPVLLVVDLRLGCINHARLTAEAIRRDGLPLLGWVANHARPDAAAADEVLTFLRHELDAPLIAELSNRHEDGAAIRFCNMDLSVLLSRHENVL